ncbi:glycosyltransferase family 2 protein [Thermodesulfobacteriota bacterium]
MSSSPLVSIIVPVFKTEEYLSECLESVARQTFTDWECIIINDGSDQPDLIEKTTNKILKDKARLIHQENRGLPAARNTGVETARGKYLVCLDSDDYIHPDFLQKTVPAIQAPAGFDVVYSWTQQFGTCSDMLIPPSEISLYLLLHRNLFPVTVLFKKDIWTAIGGFDELMTIGHEDWDFWLRAQLAGCRFSCVPEALFYYRRRHNSMVEGTRKQWLDSVHYIRHKHAGIYFMPLHKMITYPAFRKVPLRARIRFWLTGIFFHYLPPAARRMLFALYRKL